MYKQHFKEEIEKALTIRLVEQELLDLFSKGKLNGTVHTCVGQEFSGVFISKYLKEYDHIVSNHRGHGHYISRFNDIKGLFAEVMGKTEGCSGGLGGSQHITNKNYLSNGIQGGMIPIAAGIALYNKKFKIDALSVAFIGDGTLGEGVIYETFNLASKWELPLVIVMENNSYAQSTSQRQTFAGDIKKRIEGFGMNYFKTNTWDLKNLDNICYTAIKFAREKTQPCFIEIETYRLNSHSKGDDNRILEEINHFEDIDILNKIFLDDNSEYKKYIKNKKEEIENLSKNVESSKDFIKITEDLSGKLVSLERKIDSNPNIMVVERYNKLIYNALKKTLKENGQSIMIGEDIENISNYTSIEYGGAFKVSKNLSDLYKGRVLNTPISEAAITGVVAGYSIKAGRSIVEIMFGDFITLIFDQVLQHISKFELMFNGKINCPIIIRTPMGGKRGYGPTHSQSIEKHFIGIPNFAVIALNHRISPEYIFDAICDVKGTPFMIIENKILYTIETDISSIPGYKFNFTNTQFPALEIKPVNEDAILTVICYGETLYEIERLVTELFIEEEIFIEIICPSIISPIDFNSVMISVSETKNLLIIEEGCNIASWGSEIISKLIENNVEIRNLLRFSNNTIVPSSYKAEMEILPTKENIKRAILQLYNSI